MQQQHIRLGDDPLRPFDVGWGKAGVGAGCDDDAVLPGVIHQDGGDARAGVPIREEVRAIDAVRHQGLAQGAAEIIPPDPAEHTHPRAQPGRGHGLIRAFAAGRGEKPVA